MNKYLLKQKATELRLKGLSYDEIKRKISVSKRTLGIWLRDIPFIPKNKRGLSEAFIKQGAKLHNERINKTKEIIELAKNEIGILSKRELNIAGTILYWGEGTKTDEEVSISNSDPNLIKFAMRWLREICRVPNDKFRLQLHIHTDINANDCQRYWSEITKIPLSQFEKTYIKQSSLGHRKNILYNGTLKIRVLDRNLHRKIMGWIQGLKLQSVPVAQLDRASAFQMSPALAGRI